MREKIIIRRNPFVILRQLIILQFLMGFICLIPTILEYFGIIQILLPDLYKNIYFTIIAIALNILIITLVFVRWHLTLYTITKSKVIIKKNFIVNREEHYKLKDIDTFQLSQRYSNRIFGSANLIGWDKNGDRLFVLKDIPEPAYHLSLIEQFYKQKRTSESKKTYNGKNIKKIIKSEESQELEFKSTFVWDKRRKEASKNIQHSVMKTIAGFMNTEGGTLIIGVNDKKEVVGLEDDLKNIKKKDLDGFENFFNIVFTNTIGLEFRNYIEIFFDKVNKKDICIINVKPSKKPVYVKNKKEEEFFIRAGNATHPLRISEATRYIEEHFKK